ncbi:uncharacterized protein LOC142605849 [Castanea sativa]|uniref:uncharacterized protein LOC142605849 n=1 Tax=Castanea sativa TaxID=21020 RepID=UPI003F650B87
MIDREQLVLTNAPLVGFRGTRVFPLSAVTLPVTVGDYPQQITKDVTFLVVNCSSAYNAIIGWPILNSWKVVTSTYHLMIKFPTEYEVGELCGDQVAARATYQRLMNKMFTHQIGRNVKVYVDNMLVKSKRENDHLNDLKETFATLRSYNMKLNSSKCAFGVVAGKLLGFMVFQRGIKVNPDKVRAIMEMTPPRNMKEVQSLNGKVAVLNRFGGIPGCHQRGLNQGEKWSTNACVLHQSSTLRHRGKGAEEHHQWSVHTDGSSNRHAGGVGVVLHSPKGDEIECIVRLNFPITKNEAEYEALVAELDLAKAVGATSMILRCESQEINSERNWTTPIVSYLKDTTLPGSKEAARKLKVQAARFVLIKDILYKRDFSCPYLRCLSLEEADYFMREVHEGICRNHSGSRSLVHKMIRAGYHWPTMQKDAQAYVKAYDKCQRFSNDIKQPVEELTPMGFCSMGTGHHGPIPDSNETAEVPSSRHELLHQMGRS